MKTPRSRQPSGFSLVELLVAMTITALIVVSLASVSSMAMNTWSRSKGEIRASQQAKVLLDQLAKDFESMVVRRGNNYEWLLAQAAGTSANMATNVPTLTFYTAATDRYDGNIGNHTFDLGGDVSLVNYVHTIRDNFNLPDSDPDSIRSYMLARRLIDPKATFDSYLGRNNLASAATFTSFRREEQLSENIGAYTLTFNFEFPVANPGPGMPKSEIVPVTLTNSTVGNSASVKSIKIQGDRVTFDPSPSNWPALSPGLLTDNPKLVSVGMAVTVFTDNGMRRIAAAFKAGNMAAVTNQKAAMYNKESFTYTRVVKVHAP